MKTVFTAALLLSVAMMTACSSSPEQPVRDPNNDPDAQRSRAGHAQDELGRDTAK